jgi:hypothetical protein
MNRALLTRPSAFLPPCMSFAALAIVLLHVAMHGTAREPDEGAAAHLFQLLIVAQVPLAVYFSIRWLPKAPRQGVKVLVLQLASALLACAPVAALGL